MENTFVRFKVKIGDFIKKDDFIGIMNRISKRKLNKQRRKIEKYVQKNILRMLLFVVLLLFLLYIFLESFRLHLLKVGIDPNFIIGFFTIMALLLSLIQSLNDRKNNYNMRLAQSIEDKGLRIIGKLLTIKQKSESFYNTLQQCKKVMNSRNTWKEDFNDTLSKKDIDDGLELVVAYIETYFSEERLKWNKIIDKLSAISTYNANIVENYKENMHLILEGVSFSNKILDDIDYYIAESKEINKDIEKLTLEMRNNIVLKINDRSKRLKDNFDFRF